MSNRDQITMMRGALSDIQDTLSRLVRVSNAFRHRCIKKKNWSAEHSRVFERWQWELDEAPRFIEARINETLGHTL